ncbi:hypothetical protein K469DRAFT_217933 [Zopfia rhizophila CBS 207.26]|uniref:Uncharacterized protein n=1 Tax=Zopfia rhizophila CBS 207.26 TaxID=1314779 RepID=A0A6A6DXK3_9PEZI|nr:hypothetical protein K469DRAFT_217933 [Zopfia rhizophila CBS 207.26]
MHRNVLYKIYNTLQQPPPVENAYSAIIPPAMATATPLTTSSIPALLPGVHLDGFQLEHQRSLQITVLTQVTMDLLNRIERRRREILNTLITIPMWPA